MSKHNPFISIDKDALDISVDAGHAQGNITLRMPNAFFEKKHKHGYVVLTEEEFRLESEKTAGNYDVHSLQFKDKFLMFGDAAAHHIRNATLQRASRYNHEYIGYMTAFYIYTVVENKWQWEGNRKYVDVNLAVSYPPGDAVYREDLLKAIVGRSASVTFIPSGSNVKHTINYKYVMAYPEAYGGFYNYFHYADGSRIERFDNSQIPCYVIDFGGGTTEVMLTVNYNPDMNTFSIPLGINNIRDAIARELRAQHKDAYPRGVNPYSIDTAIHNGYVVLGGKQVDVSHIVESATNALFVAIDNNMDNFLQGYPLCTGGGYVHLNSLLSQRYPDVQFAQADDKLDEIDFANSRGGAIMLATLRNGG